MTMVMKKERKSERKERKTHLYRGKKKKKIEAGPEKTRTGGGTKLTYDTTLQVVTRTA